MRNVAVSAWIAAVSMGCAGSSADAWTGEYAVTVVEDLWLCEDPSAPPTHSESAHTIAILRDERGLYVDGRCRVGLTVDSDTHARIVPFSCEAVLSTGDRVTVEWLNGRYDLDGARIHGEQQYTIHFADGSCLNGTATTTGMRL